MDETPQTPRGAERRRLERAPTTLRGKVFPGGLDCTIKDFNRGGARLAFSGPPPADDQMVLVVWSTGAAAEAVSCWRRGSEIGLRFLRRFDMHGRVPDRFADVRTQWRERRPKLRRGALKDCPAMVDYNGTPAAVKLN